jgi:lysophospholipase L1-like esterase
VLRPDYSREQLDVWLRRHEAFAERARQGGIDLAFFGDSLTDGWRNQGRAAWDAHFEPLRAANFGLPGDRTQQVLWRMQHGELDGYSPRVIVLLIGTNNLDPGLGEPSLTPRNSPAEIVAGVSAIVQLVTNRFPQTHILLHGLLPRGRASDPVRSEIVAVNSGLRQLEERDPNLRFFDTRSVFLQPDGELGPGFMSDGLHLSEVGYQLWAQALLPELTRLLGTIS